MTRIREEEDLTTRHADTIVQQTSNVVGDAAVTD